MQIASCRVNNSKIKIHASVPGVKKICKFNWCFLITFSQYFVKSTQLINSHMATLVLLSRSQCFLKFIGNKSISVKI